jgi:alkaline phosphatase D
MDQQLINNYRLFFFISFLFISHFVIGQKPISGPFVGGVTDHSAKIWVAYKQKSPLNITLTDGVNYYMPTQKSETTRKSKTINTLDFGRLPQNTKFTVLCNGKAISKSKIKVQFATQKTNPDTSQIRFLAASCALILHKPLAVFFPGASRKIFKSMSTDSTDFMLWMGDNVYLLGFHLKSEKRVFRKNMNIRTKFKKYDKLLSSQPNYSIWDDHDFGPNNTDNSFVGKNYTTKVFKQMWPNPELPIPELGNFYTFKHEDIQFFMLDDRTNKVISDSEKKCLGSAQIEWLKTELSNSTASFKFIVNGNQIIKKQRGNECLRYFKDEFNDIFTSIRSNKIDGVVLLSGDVHHTELLRDKEIGNYPIYELTCSPMTSKLSLPPQEKTQIVENTIVSKKRNYCLTTIIGNTTDRKLRFEIFDTKGKLIWMKEIMLSEISN